MTTDEKLRIIKNWTIEFKIKPRPDGLVVVRTTLEQFSMPYTVCFNSVEECADVRFDMVQTRVHDLCQHIEGITGQKHNERII